MSSADRVPFILNEQYVSPDLNTLQNLWARWLTDAVYLGSKRDVPTVNTALMDIAANLSVVIGGLETRPTGANVQVQHGALLQLSPIAPATDDPFTESSLAFNVAAEVIAMPAPGADTWYLVQGEPADVADPTVSVNIWNGSAFVSTPGQVKRRRREIAFTLKAGTSTSIPVPDTNQTPIAGVFRPAGGGAVLNAHIVDLRPMKPWPRGEAREIKLNRWATSALVGNPTTIVLDAKVESDDGELSYLTPDGSSPTAFDPGSSAYKATGSPAFAANEWWYLYLCPLSFYPGVRPSHLYPNAVGQGLLVLSDVAPSGPGQRRNSAPIGYPPPFAAHSCPAFRAVLVGMLKRNGANTAWKPMSCLGDRVYPAGALGTWLLLAGSTPPQALFTTVGGTADQIPAGATSFDVQVVADAAGAGGGRTITVSDPAGTVQVYEQLMANDEVDESIVFRDIDLTRGQSYELASTTAEDLAAYLHGFRF